MTLSLTIRRRQPATRTHHASGGPGPRFAVRIPLALLLLFGLAAAVRPAVAATPVAGRLNEADGLQVLELWGDPSEAGYAHGYLMAEKIVTLFDEFVLDDRAGVPAKMYASVLQPSVRRLFVWTPEQEAELAGLLRGMQDRLGADRVRSAKLDRPLDIDDLKAVNALSDWRGALCSTFSVWGSRTADGQTITGRNLDYFSTTGMARSQLIIVRRGDAQHRGWAAVSWPAVIGVLTAMNADGVSIALHDTRGLAATEAGGFTPRALALRAALERAGPNSFIDDVRGVFESLRVFPGNNVHLSGPAGSGHDAAAVFEYDGNSAGHGVSLRRPDPNTPELADAIVCTNHMRLRMEPTACRRYASLVEQLGGLAKRRATLDADGALEMIRSVANKTTLHSVVFLPARHTMLIHVPAVQERAVRFELDKWLAPAADGGPAGSAAGGRP